MSWQPIETAPKDGRYIWLADADSLRVGFWPGWSDDPSDVTGLCWADMASAEAGGPRGLHFAPTHWQPTPSLPK